MKKMGHELKANTKVKFESYETTRALDVNLRNKKTFFKCAMSVLENVPRYEETLKCKT